MIKGEDVYINGDGKTSRDFCYIDNVIQANLLAAITGSPNNELVSSPDAINQIYNIAVGGRTTLNDLYNILRDSLSKEFDHLRNSSPIYRDFRAGDVRHSQANIDKAKEKLGYEPSHQVKDGLIEAMDWYIKNLQ